MGALIYFRGLRSWATMAVGLLLGLWLAPLPVTPIKGTSYFDGVVRIVGVPVADRVEQTAFATTGTLNVRLTCSTIVPMHYGDRWKVSGEVKPLGESASQMVRPGGLQGVLRAFDAVRISEGPWPLVLADTWRADFESLTHRALPPEDADWIDLLCFRDGSISTQDELDLQDSGQSYLFSASGLHVYVLVGILFVTLTTLRVARPVTILTCLATLAVYWMATGMHMSTFRAAISCVLFLSAFLVQKEPDTLSAMGLAGSGFLILFPAGVYLMGFQVSTLIVAAMALYMPRLPAVEPNLRSVAVRGLRSALWAVLIIILAGQPVISYYVGRFSLAALPATILTAFVAVIAVALCFCAYPVSKLSLPLAVGFLSIATPLVDFIRVVVHWLAGTGFSFDIPSFSGYWLVLYYGLWLATWRRRLDPA